MIITGASDGLGAEAARILQNQGHSVAIVGRSPEKTEALGRRLEVPWYVADFCRLDQVRDLAQRLDKDFPRIDVLANNAGGIFSNREVTIDGHEKTFQVNHLAPFLLTNLLMPKLLGSGATVINTSSEAHLIFSRFDPSNWDLSHGYSSRIAYGNAKLANILFTRELHKRFGAAGLNAAAFHPGVVATNFAATSNDIMRVLYQSFVGKLFFISPQKGADTLVWLASTAAGTDWKPGEYYYKRQVYRRLLAVAKDDAQGADLWEKSVRMVGLV